MKFLSIYHYYYSAPLNYLTFINFFKFLYSPDLSGATWFLFVLFFSSILGKLLNDCLSIKRQKLFELIKLFLTFILFLISYELFIKNNESLPYYMEIIPVGLFFVTCGHFMSHFKIDLKPIIRYFTLIFALIYYLWFANFSHIGIDLISRKIPNIFIYILISLCGIYVFCEFSKLLSFIKNKFNIKIQVLKYIGNHTLAILCFHFVGFRVIFTIFYLFRLVDATQLQFLTPHYNSIILTPITIIFTICFCLVIDYVYSKIKKKVCLSIFHVN